jgi:hypothetical protein
MLLTIFYCDGIFGCYNDVVAEVVMSGTVADEAMKVCRS